MHFLQIAQAPEVVALPQMKDRPPMLLLMPKFTIDNFTEWGSELEAANVERVTAGMDDIRKREYLSMYPPSSPDLNELRRLVRTSPGILRVVSTCMKVAKCKERLADNSAGKDLPELTEAEMTELLVNNGMGRLSTLAWALADMQDSSLVDPSPKPPAKPGEGKDPLKLTAKSASKK